MILVEIYFDECTTWKNIFDIQNSVKFLTLYFCRGDYYIIDIELYITILTKQGVIVEYCKADHGRYAYSILHYVLFNNF